MMKGDDLAAFTRGMLDDSDGAADAAPRITAFRSARGLRSLIKARFGTKHRIYNAPGWAKAIRVQHMDVGWYQVIDNATYSKGRGVKFSLAWVYDNAPMISGKKNWTAVPIQGRAPIHANGRRYMWPSEADRAGWELEIAPVMGKTYKLIFGRRSRFEPWQAMWRWVPPFRAKKALDLTSHHNRYASQLDQAWGEELDRRTAKRARKRL